MKLKPVLALSLAALALAACVAEPESRDLVTRTSSADARITYTISKYVEPFEIQGIFATHKLRSNLVIVEVDRDARIRYIGYPDDVQIELGNAMADTCRNEGTRFRGVEDNINPDTRRGNLYFICA